MAFERAAGEAEKMLVPRFAEQPGLVIVDSTWGTIQPLSLDPEIETVAELEVISHLEAGGPLLDTRHEAQHRQATIPGARSIPHEEIVARIGELDAGEATILFCNGPQCKATPQAVGALLGYGYPARSLRYYRGGIHDWMALGLPIEGSRATEPGAGRG